MSLRPLALLSIPALLALATACSSHWSAAAGTRWQALDLRAGAPAVFDVTVELARTDDSPLPCGGVTWDLELEFAEGTGGEVTLSVQRDGEDASDPETHDAAEVDALLLQAGDPWTSVTDDACRVDLVLTLDTPHALRGAFRLESAAEDLSAASGDEPGPSTYTVRARVREAAPDPA